uniref:Uncharacterized protein n=1 Tax=Anguilla anguilla TaxID=7936 RepID=A0A0E9RHZ9_ANGAN
MLFLFMARPHPPKTLENCTPFSSCRTRVHTGKCLNKKNEGFRLSYIIRP